MKLFIDAVNIIHALEDDGSQDFLIQPDWIPATEAEADAIRYPAPTLAQAQVTQAALLAASYSEAVQASVSLTTAGGVTKTFQADSNSQNLLVTALVGYNAQKAVPSDFYWKAADNTQVPFTLADLNGLSAAMLAQGWAAFQKLTTLKAQVAAATTVAEVQAIAW